MSGGIVMHAATQPEAARAFDAFMAHLAGLGLDRYVTSCQEAAGAGHVVRFQLQAQHARRWAPGRDTMQLCAHLQLDTRSRADDLAREILLAMLLSPIPLAFPSHDELASAVRIRQFIVQAARNTLMNFHTTQVQRPAEDWVYAEASGFTLQPGRPLIAALERATQPQMPEQAYSFSCYRATEYVILLAIAREAQCANPELLRQLQQQWERRAIMSGRFHDVFLREYGSIDSPLPIKYYIPGDRIWFRNPDSQSSDVAGFEGSWVFYLGDGMFPNFWRRDKPFTLLSKCVEVYHWRHATYRDASGELQMDEDRVDRLVAQTLANPGEREQVFQRMFRLRDPRGVYAEGGCMDATRESPRWVRPDTADIVLPGS